ncbi:LOW QUALITY PROTEIN: cilia- and flagella-associated protein 46 [Lethenteron reissneri]|uniref:LOW QUALITY PROTEIN: cilia- and flagella-associated protein 46 n=1 Tax=Lethenteron reissneri TaxID=7753 RepID=UPI002AB6046B|nr:LOW QUALITY PROTEIN: cilia- and flagella-associated protein 46 [Lethenteron reissneri]
MEARVRQALEAARRNRDSSTLLKGYEILVTATTEGQTEGICLAPDLFVICAELAIENELLGVGEECVRRFLQTAPALGPLLVRIVLCQAQLNGVLSPDRPEQLTESMLYYVKAAHLAKQDPRLVPMLYRISVLWWRSVQPCWVSGLRGYLAGALSALVPALGDWEDTDPVWTAELMICLVESLLDAGRSKEAASAALRAAQYTRTRASHFLPHVLALQVRHRLLDSAKAAKEAASSPRLKALVQMQRMKAQLESGESPADINAQLKQILKLLASCDYAPPSHHSGPVVPTALATPSHNDSPPQPDCSPEPSASCPSSLATTLGDSPMPTHRGITSRGCSDGGGVAGNDEAVGGQESPGTKRELARLAGAQRFEFKAAAASTTGPVLAHTPSRARATKHTAVLNSVQLPDFSPAWPSSDNWGSGVEEEEGQEEEKIIPAACRPPGSRASRSGENRSEKIVEQCDEKVSDRRAKEEDQRTDAADSPRDASMLVLEVPERMPLPPEDLSYDKLSLLLELAQLCLDQQQLPLASQCLMAIEACRPAGTVLLRVECVRAQLSVSMLGDDLSHRSVQVRLAAVQRLQAVLQSGVEGRCAPGAAASSSDAARVTQELSAALWNLSVPLLGLPSMPSRVCGALVIAARRLQEAQSPLHDLRWQLHWALAEMEQDQVVRGSGSAERHLLEAERLAPSAGHRDRARAALQRHRHRCAANSLPSSSIEEAATIIYQMAGITVLPSGARALLIKAGRALAPDTFMQVLEAENPHRAECSDGPLAEQARLHAQASIRAASHLLTIGPDRERDRVHLWAELAALCVRHNVWDVSRVATRFCLLYDDGRWRAQLPEKESNGPQSKPQPQSKQQQAPQSQQQEQQLRLDPQPQQQQRVAEVASGQQQSVLSAQSDREVLTSLANINFMCAEATAELLRREGVGLYEVPPLPAQYVVPGPPPGHEGLPPDQQSSPPDQLTDWKTYTDWLHELSERVIGRLLRGAELGAELGDVAVVMGAVVRLWNHVAPLVASGREGDVLDQLTTGLNVLRETHTHSDPELLGLLCAAVARGMCSTWLPPAPPVPPVPPVSSAATRKQQQGGNKQQGGGPAISPEVLIQLKKALEVCEFGLQMTSVSPEGSASRQLLSAWARIKLGLQQPPVLPPIQGGSPVMRVLLALEAHSLSPCGLAPPPCPSLTEVSDQAASCEWTQPLVELQLWTRISTLALTNQHEALALQASHNALRLQGANVTGQRCRLLKGDKQQEKWRLLSVAAAVQGQAVARRHGRGSLALTLATDGFLQSARFGEQAGSVALVLQAVRHMWNVCASVAPCPLGRAPLRAPLIALLTIVNNSCGSQRLRQQCDVKPSETSQCEEKGEEERMPGGAAWGEEALAAWTRLALLMSQIHEDTGDLGSAMATVNHALSSTPRGNHRLPLYRRRVWLKARLGQALELESARFHEGGERACARAWLSLALVHPHPAQQLLCYRHALLALQSPECVHLRVLVLRELSRWALAQGSSCQDAVTLLTHAGNNLIMMHRGDTCGRPNTGTDEAATHVHTHGNVSSWARAWREKARVQDLDSLAQLLVDGCTVLGRCHGGHARPLMHGPLSAFACVMRMWELLLEMPTAAAAPTEKSDGVKGKHKDKRDDSGKERHKDKKTPSGSAKRSKAAAPTRGDAPRRKGSPAPLPCSLHGWAAPEWSEETRAALAAALLSDDSFPEPDVTVDSLGDLAQLLCELHCPLLALPVLQLALALCTSERGNAGLGQLYSLRLAELCTQLNMHDTARSHLKAVGSVPIPLEELASCREEVEMRKLGAAGTRGSSHSFSPVCKGGHSAVSCLPVWLDKAEVLVRLGLTQPAHFLLAEIRTTAQVLGEQRSLGRCLCLLAQLSLGEGYPGGAGGVLEVAGATRGGARPLLEAAQEVCGNMAHVGNVAMTRAESLVQSAGPHSQRQACRVLGRAVRALHAACERCPSQEQHLGPMVASLQYRMVSVLMQAVRSHCETGKEHGPQWDPYEGTHMDAWGRPPWEDFCPFTDGETRELQFVLSSLRRAGEALARSAETLIQSGEQHHSAHALMQAAWALGMQARCSRDEEVVRQSLLEAWGLGRRAVLTMERSFRETQTLMPALHSAQALPACCLASVKLQLVQLLQLGMEERERSERAERAHAAGRSALQRRVERHLDTLLREQRSPAERHVLWSSTLRSLPQTALTQLSSALLLLSRGPNEDPNGTQGELGTPRGRVALLSAHCLGCLSRLQEPQWQENWGDTEPELMEEDDGSTELTFLSSPTPPVLHMQAELSLPQAQLCQSVELMSQALGVALREGDLHTASSAALALTDAMGPSQPRAAAQYLALFQSCVASRALAVVLRRVAGAAGSSRAAACLRTATRDRGQAGCCCPLTPPVAAATTAPTGSAAATHALKQTVWRYLAVSTQHLVLINELPPNLDIVILQHSLDRRYLYGAVLDKPGSCVGDKKKMEKLGGSQQLASRTRVARIQVKATELDSLLCSTREHRERAQQSYLQQEKRETHTISDDDRQLQEGLEAIVGQTEQYLQPVLAQLGVSALGLMDPVGAAVSARCRGGEKSTRASAEQAAAPAAPHLIILADLHLMQLPLELLPGVVGRPELSPFPGRTPSAENPMADMEPPKTLQLQPPPRSMSRDFSLQILHGRWVRAACGSEEKGEEKPGKEEKARSVRKRNPVSVSQPVPPHCSIVEGQGLKYIIDPHGHTREAGSNVAHVWTRIVDSSCALTSRWEGLAPSTGPPNAAQCERLVSAASALLLCAPKRFLSFLAPEKLTSLSLNKSPLVLLLDQTLVGSTAFNPDSTLALERERALGLPGPLLGAIMLSLAGARAVLAPLWPGKAGGIGALERVCEALLVRGMCCGQVPQLQAGSPLSGDAGGPSRPSTPSAISGSCWSTEEGLVLYGLPNVVIR